MLNRIYIVSLFLILTGCFSHKNQYVVLFDKVDGLQVGSSVWHNGIIVGHVSKLTLADNGVFSEIRLQDTVKIPSQSVFTVQQELLGSSHIDIDYSKNNSFLTRTDTVMGKYKEISSLNTLDSAKRKEIKMAIKKIAEGLNDLIDKTADSTKNK